MFSTCHADCASLLDVGPSVPGGAYGGYMSMVQVQYTWRPILPGIVTSPSFLIVNGGSPAERESAGPTPLWGKRGGV